MTRPGSENLVIKLYNLLYAMYLFTITTRGKKISLNMIFHLESLFYNYQRISMCPRFYARHTEVSFTK